MIFSMCVLLATIANCWAYNSPVVYTKPTYVHGGEGFDVICFYNNYITESWEMILLMDDRKVETVHVDDFSIKYRVDRTPKEGTTMKFQCLLGDMSSHLRFVDVPPLLNVQDFECQHSGAGSPVECSFSQLGDRYLWQISTYYLSMDNGEARKCRGSERMKCIPEYELDYTAILEELNMRPAYEYTVNFNHTFTLELHLSDNVQKQEIRLTRIQMEIPHWPPRWPEISTTYNTTCVDFGSHAWAWASSAYEWRVKLLPRNSLIKEQDANVLPEIDDMRRRPKCFEIPSYRNQAYEVRMWLRYNYSESPWPTEYFVFHFSTQPSIPEQPPELVSSGFFFDSVESDLYVFWQQLDELEFCGPNFTYIVQSNNSIPKRPFLLGNNSAVFHKWDAKEAGSVSVWSQNSLGRSMNGSIIRVPILTNSTRRQPQKLWYNLKSNTMFWQPPQEVKGLIGYTIFWCSVSKNSSQLCADQSLKHLDLEKSQLDYHFNESMAEYNKAVAAQYKDNSSGGMLWIGPSWGLSGRMPSSVGFGIKHYTAVLVVLALIPFIFVSFQKVKKAMDINVNLPVGILDPVEDWKKSGSPQTSSEIAFPGSISPKALVNIKTVLLETAPTEITQTNYTFGTSQYISLS